MARKKVTRFKLKLAMFALVFLSVANLIVATVASYNIYQGTLRQHNKNIVLINLFFEPIEIDINGQKLPLDLFDIKVIQRKTNQLIRISIFDARGYLLEKLDLPHIADNSHLLIKPVTKYSNYCFFSADVQSFYDTSKPDIVEKVNYLSTEPTSYLLRVLVSQSTFIFPGFAQPEDLPLFAERSVIKGIYPIECDKLTSSEEQIKVVNLYKNYSSKAQRDFYYKSLEDINNLTL